MEVGYLIRLDHLFEAATDGLHSMTDVKYDASELIFIILAQYPDPLIEETWVDPEDNRRFQSVVNALIAEIYPILARLNVFTTLKNITSLGHSFLITVDRPD